MNQAYFWPRRVDLLDTGYPASVMQQHVALAADQRPDFGAQVRGKPIEQHDDALLGTSRRWKRPIQKVKAVLGPIATTLLKLKQDPGR
jgi:hypothetical protein